MRTFPSGFTGHLTDQYQKPYHILEIDWGGSAGTKYYLDRPSNSFLASGTRCPGTIESSLVVDWGSVHLTLKEQQIGSVDSLTIRIEDHNGEITRLLSGVTPQQHRVVRIWRMFDENDCTWAGGTDPANDSLVFLGVTKPHTWSERDNVISIDIEDPARYLTETIECPAHVGVFDNIPEDSQDKSIPLVWGKAERVEAVLVSRPWETKIDGTADLTTWSGLTLDVEDHPDDLKIPLTAGVSAVMQVYIGNETRPQAFAGKFHLSANKATIPSTFEITSPLGYQTFTVTIYNVDDTGTSRALATADDSTLTGEQHDAIDAGQVMASIVQSGHTLMGTMMDITDDGTNLSFRFRESSLTQHLAVGQHVTFYYQRPYVTLASVSSMTDGYYKTVTFDASAVTPTGYLEDLSAVYGDCNVQVFQSGIWNDVTIQNIQPDTPGSGVYTAQMQNNSDLSIITALTTGQSIRFPMSTNALSSLKQGNVIRPQKGPWIYACNALPSVGITRVEGYGFTSDAYGAGAQDFIVLDDTVTTSETDPSIGSIIRSSSVYSINTNDGTWDKTGGPDEGLSDDLGRHITTITFNQAPRFYNQSLTSNRLWVTLLGVEDHGDGGGALISNPALVILSYLTHPKLLNIDTSYIDEASFTAAASTLSDHVVGFAQVASADGLTYLQDIARQCRSILFFDQGQVSIKVLQNSVSTTVATFTEGNILEATLAIHETDIIDLISRVIGSWRYEWALDYRKPRTIAAINQGVELEFGINSKSIELWLYNDRGYALTELTFWLTRWSQLYREVSFTAFLEAVKLQPGDWITVNYTQGVIFAALDLAYASGTTVHSDSYTFTSADIGRQVTVLTSSSPWSVGSYTITGVSSGNAILNAAPASGAATGGSWKLGGQLILSNVKCEVLEVKDRGQDALVDVKCRYVQNTF